MRKGMAVILPVLIFVMLFSQIALAEEGIGETRVNAIVDRHLIFLNPADHMIETGKEETNIGVIGLKEMLLFSNEYLRIVVITDSEMKQIDGKGRLSWEAICGDLPQYINEDGKWDVTVNINKKDWDRALPGKYKGVVYFEVYSSISQELLLTKSTTLETIVKDSAVKSPIKPPPTGDTKNVLWYAILLGLSTFYLIAFASQKWKKRLRNK